jgi:hypothetical protein
MWLCISIISWVEGKLSGGEISSFRGEPGIIIIYIFIQRWIFKSLSGDPVGVRQNFSHSQRGIS